MVMCRGNGKRSALAVIAMALGLIAGVSGAASAVNVVTAFPSYQGESNLYFDSYNAVTGAITPLARYSAVEYRGQQFAPHPLATKAATGWTVLHPYYAATPATSLWAVMSFKAPATGDLQYDLRFCDGAGGVGCTTRAILFTGNAANASSILRSADVAKGVSPTMTGSVYVQKDQWLRIAIDPKIGMAYDSTCVAGTLNMMSTVPEPGALAGVGSGLIGTLLFGLRRRRG